jgi:predicted membrane-bound spermidine synthase
MTTGIPVGVFFALFTISGFAGLIYQSIWSHYLKLFLGHAAYAQTLVLAIFMGGMAIGAWLVSRFTDGIRNMLLGYAVAELGIGVLAIAFHEVFRAVTAWSFDSILPALGGTGVDAFKWTVASMLILPASILLGTTFPLMSAGILRLAPEASGRSLTMLYFTNSFGAAVGVLASGFLLIERFGLPGTILIAGAMNVALATTVWLLARRLPAAPAALPPRRAPSAAAPTDRFTAGILMLACCTGTASFIYEITWIRMLTQALGASTHSFEIMLAAFILAMSLGAFWFRDRIGAVRDHVAWLAGILFAKGLFAVAALWVYGEVLGLVRWLVNATARSDGGYVLATSGGMLGAILVMFPAAFCAGMTLPLATHALTERGRGEASIGRVYAANTAGCIIGAVLATHVGMELAGVKGLTAAGAVLDVGMGIVLLAAFGAQRRMIAIAAVLASCGVAAFSLARLDTLQMASGVYRYGEFFDPAVSQVRFFRDGKTATIAVVDNGTLRSIRTNGKPDASIETGAGAPASLDEYTMVLAAVLPLAYRPQARSVANIGFGSGLTTHALLGSPRIRNLDTIEIERMVIEGARHFQPRNARAFDDARSHLHVEDAKTFFAAGGRRYEVVVSEPSNPWVSGTATLFSEEFYAQIRRYLEGDGLLVQWIQAYEIDLPLLGSVFKALGAQMGDYAVYSTGPDILIVATPARHLPPLAGDVFEFPALRADLAYLGLRGLGDLEALRVGGRFALEPLLAAQPLPANSDYFPVLDQQAPRARFRRDTATALTGIRRDVAPVMALFDEDYRTALQHLGAAGLNRPPGFDRALAGAEAIGIVLTGEARRAKAVAEPTRRAALVAGGLLGDCSRASADWVDAVSEVARASVPFLQASDSEPLFRHVRESPCWRSLDGAQRQRIELLEAINARSPEAIARLAPAVLGQPGALPEGDRGSFLAAGIAAHLVAGRAADARDLRDRHLPGLRGLDRESLPLRLTLAHLARFTRP